jgi:glycosyltransferase involved in cell wall biosynthesis
MLTIAFQIKLKSTGFKMEFNKKLSFIIAAHNEEKIIENTILNLLKIPYSNYEILIGLDGCTDNTEEIVEKLSKNFSKVKYRKLNLREGKPRVVDEMIKKAKGEIIIINDADWIFRVKNKESFDEFFSVFEDLKIGGIAESFPAEWHVDRLKAGDLGYRMEAYSSYLWYEFQKDNFTYKKNNLRYLKVPKMFMTNIFRKELYKKNYSLGDDFERTYDIMSGGHKIVIFENEEIPRIATTYTSTSLRDLFRQKVRTSIARDQLKDLKKSDVNIENYYLPVIKYIFKNSWKLGINIGLMMSLWIFISTSSVILSKFKSFGTKEGWNIRIKR